MITGLMPQRVSEIENSALSAAITTSQAAAIPVPPPKQPPWINATVGTGRVLRSHTAFAVRSEASRLAAAPCGRTASSQPRSAPAWKCLPLPASTTTRASPLARTLVQPAISASIIALS